MASYTISDRLILRTPYFSYADYSLVNDEEFVRHPAFLTALYLANPTLYHMLGNKFFNYTRFTTKEKLTIKRYYNRMHFRPTPFGCFSSFGVVSWKAENSAGRHEPITEIVHLNFDQEIALQLADILQPSAAGLYQCNPTLYRIDREYRFIKTNIVQDQRKLSFALESYDYHSISSALMEFCKLARKRVYIMEMLTTLFRAKLTQGLADFWVAANAIKARTKIVI